jgi:hypothetical protein
MTCTHSRNVIWIDLMVWVRYISVWWDCSWISDNYIADYMPLSPEDDHDTSVDIIYPLEHPVLWMVATFLIFLKEKLLTIT